MAEGEVNFVASPATGSATSSSGSLNVVEDFGADPTGSVDSSAAFQAAIDAAFDAANDARPEIVLPPGYYQIDSPLTVGPALAGDAAYYNFRMRSAGYGMQAGGRIATVVNFRGDHTGPGLTFQSVIGASFFGIAFRNEGQPGIRESGILITSHPSPQLRSRNFKFVGCSFSAINGCADGMLVLQACENITIDNASEIYSGMTNSERVSVLIGKKDVTLHDEGAASGIHFRNCQIYSDVGYHDCSAVRFDRCFFGGRYYTQGSTGSFQSTFKRKGAPGRLAGVVFTSCWFGGFIANGTDVCIQMGSADDGGGLAVIGCRFGAGKRAVEAVNEWPGLWVASCYFTATLVDGDSAILLNNTEEPNVHVAANHDLGSYSQQFLWDLSGEYGSQSDGNGYHTDPNRS